MIKLSTMIDQQNWIAVGKLVAPQGLHGEIRINPSSDFPERFTKRGDRWLQKNQEEPKSIKLISGRQLPGKSIYVVRFESIQNRLAAEALIGHKLLVPSNSRPSLSKDEFHFFDLLGLEVKIREEPQPIGLISDLLHAGNDLLEIELFKGEKVLVPFVKEIVPEVNIKEGWIKITPPPGLLTI